MGKHGDWEKLVSESQVDVDEMYWVRMVLDGQVETFVADGFALGTRLDDEDDEDIYFHGPLQPPQWVNSQAESDLEGLGQWEAAEKNYASQIR